MEEENSVDLGYHCQHLPEKTLLIPRADGGGVRGYSSLLILRELMTQIAALEQNDPQARCSVSPLPMRHRPLGALTQSRSSTTKSRFLESPQPEQSGPTRASSHYLPCHYFDYIAGTSTGGCASSVQIFIGWRRLIGFVDLLLLCSVACP